MDCVVIVQFVDDTIKQLLLSFQKLLNKKYNNYNPSYNNLSVIIPKGTVKLVVIWIIESLQRVVLSCFEPWRQGKQETRVLVGVSIQVLFQHLPSNMVSLLYSCPTRERRGGKSWQWRSSKLLHDIYHLIHVSTWIRLSVMIESSIWRWNHLANCSEYNGYNIICLFIMQWIYLLILSEEVDEVTLTITFIPGIWLLGKVTLNFPMTSW